MVIVEWSELCVSMCVGAFTFVELTVFVVTGSPAARWSSLAFGAGLGIGSAYTECSQKFSGCPKKQKFSGCPKKPPPKASDVSAHVTVVESSPQVLFFES